jgi:hypothetical protein
MSWKYFPNFELSLEVKRSNCLTILYYMKIKKFKVLRISQPFLQEPLAVFLVLLFVADI